MGLHRKEQLLCISAAAPQSALTELQAQTGALKCSALGVVPPTALGGLKTSWKQADQNTNLLLTVGMGVAVAADCIRFF